uniref:SIS domain-containing protein n=1 Tax=Xiphophorus couchianus TaxID=32473 RepID=A0A3B5MIF4_9TELE
MSNNAKASPWSQRPPEEACLMKKMAHVVEREFLFQSTDYEPTLPVTEKSNPLTRDIDRASASSIVKMLQACDAQMFQEKLLVFFKNSGFNRELQRLNYAPICSYVIAGGDRALFSSQEAPEDDPTLGALRLKKVSTIPCLRGKKRVLFIGVSCGLSAPFVAGQLDFCLRHPDVYTPVLVGFNPCVSLCRNEPLPGCTLTFRSVVTRMEELAKTQKAFLINPALGPEAISGSSRMKGGSATKILLEVVFSASFSRTPVTFKYAQWGYGRAVQKILFVCFSLQCGRQVCYLGWGSLGLLGLIDASECKPTFGHSELLFPQGPEFSISHDDFLDRVLPRLTDDDAVLLLYSDSDDVDEVAKLAHRVREKTSNIHGAYHQTDGGTDDINKLCSSTINFTWSQETPKRLQHMRELSTKLLLNAVSTGAHILKGKVFKNYMIDLQVTNSKLYRRAARLLQVRIQSDVEMNQHLCVSVVQVVPLALVCLLTGCSIKEAETRLEQQPIVREAVEACLKSS